MAVVLASLFVVMVGYGSTVTVLPAHVQRVGGLAEGGVAFHVGLIVGVYALAGLVAGPIVGRLGDRLGRRPMLLAGFTGLAVTQIIFGLATSLWSLYLLRVLGGFADASLLVTATAYVADSTSEAERPRAMAWFGTAVSLGLVAGPALTGLLVGADIAVLHLNGPSVPFAFSGLLATLVLGLTGRHLAGSSRSPTPAPHAHHARHRGGLRVTAATLRPLLVLVLAAQYGLAIFEGMFVLYARDRLTLSLADISLTFIACNAVVAVMQVPAVDWLTARISSLRQVALGFAFMGLSLAGLLAVRSFPLVLVMSGAHGAGAALLIPNLSALVSSRASSGAGLALGLKNSAGGLGQFIGPFVGGSLMGVQAELPFLVTAGLLIAVAVAVQGGFAANVRHSSSPTPVGHARDEDVDKPVRVLAPASTPASRCCRRSRPRRLSRCRLRTVGSASVELDTPRDWGATVCRRRRRPGVVRSIRSAHTERLRSTTVTRKVASRTLGGRPVPSRYAVGSGARSSVRPRSSSSRSVSGST